MKKMNVALVFAAAGEAGRISVRYGRLVSDAAIAPGTERLDLELDEVNVAPGAHPTIVTVDRRPFPFSFHLRDVTSACPVWVPEAQTAALPADDLRSYAQVCADIRSKKLVSDAARMEAEPEESYENACRENRDQVCPVWLGLGRDMRIFRVSAQGSGSEGFQFWGQVMPVNHSKVALYRRDGYDVERKILFEIGPGAHCRPKLTRRLDDGVLPILHAVQYEQDIEYRLTLFASLEKEPLGPGRVRGSEPLTALSQMSFAMLSGEETKTAADNLHAETDGREEAVVCFIRVEAVNVARTPSYAWFKAPHTFGSSEFHDGLSLEDGLVYGVSTLDGTPLRDPESAVLVQPGTSRVFEMRLFHSPVAPERGEKILRQDFDSHLNAARAYWRRMLDEAAHIHVPEAAVDERMRAGLLHLQINTLGLNERGPLLPGVGWYAPIGSESAPMIQYFDAMGWREVAERCIDFFLSRQNDAGFIQVYNRYESETGPLLWTAAEHYRMTGDKIWLARVAPALKKSVRYLLEWRRRNQCEEFRAVGGYGLLNGKVADPDDFYHSYFLNAGTYLGLSGMADVLREVDAAFAAKLGEELDAYREDLLASLYDAMRRAPVIPLADGSWTPILPPWSSYNGGISFYADGGSWFSHGAFASRSSLTGPLYFALSDLLKPFDPLMDVMLKSNQFPVTRENAALSQPYYSRHDIAHLRRGEVKLFLKCFYNQFSALQDRQSYTFWEHYYGVSQHKTHEGGWFLMQCRWLLAYENASVLELFKCVPRRWLEAGKTIEISGLRTHFGCLNVSVRSSGDTISAVVDVENAPEKIVVRLPHHAGKQPTSVVGGEYDAATESVTVYGKTARVKLCFD